MSPLALACPFVLVQSYDLQHDVSAAQQLRPTAATVFDLTVDSTEHRIERAAIPTSMHLYPLRTPRGRSVEEMETA